jgi:selenocysteine lyase/cysteine desulfurase
MDIRTFRAQFPIAGRRSYLYNGALTPTADPVRRELDRWTRDWQLDPIARYDNFEPELDSLRDAFARLVGADPDEIAVTDNTSRASNLVVSCLRTRPGSNVVIDDTTYPSAAYPWPAMTDHELRRVEASSSADPLDAVGSQVDDETVAVCVSHVSPESGFRHDLAPLAALAHQHGAVLVVDAAQTTGVVPIDVAAEGVDALVTTAMKWLLGPPGIGLAYVSRVLLDDAPVQQVGYMGVDLEMSEDWPMTEMPPLRNDGRRLELGLPALMGLGPARAGIELLEQVGIPVIEQRVAELVNTAIAGLLERGVRVRTPTDAARRAGVIAIEHDSAVELAAHLRANGVDIGGYPWGVARIDPHAFNDEDDIAALLDGYDTYRRA